MRPRTKARLEAEIQRELSEIIATEAKDPVLKETLPDIVRVALSQDGLEATVYVYAGDGGNSQEVMDAFRRDRGFLRSRLAHRIRVRRVPRLRFMWEDPLHGTPHS